VVVFLYSEGDTFLRETWRRYWDWIIIIINSLPTASDHAAWARSSECTSRKVHKCPLTTIEDSDDRDLREKLCIHACHIKHDDH
jgi:hypothetical protein